MGRKRQRQGAATTEGSSRVSGGGHEPPPLQPAWRRVAKHALVRVLIVLSILCFLNWRGDLGCRGAPEPTREEKLAEAVRQALAARDSRPRGCRLTLRRTIDGTIHRTTMLDLAAILDHAEMLELSREEIAELEKRRGKCEAACAALQREIERIEGTQGDNAGPAEALREQQCAEHAQRVLEALDLLTPEQRELADAYLSTDTLSAALDAWDGEPSASTGG